MSCSKIRKHLEAAEEEIRQALTASLENKHEENLTLLCDTLNNIKELLITTPIRGTDNTTEYYKKNAEHNFKLDSPYMDNKVINFPTSIPGTKPVDTNTNISFDSSAFDAACTNNASPFTFGTDYNLDLTSEYQGYTAETPVGIDINLDDMVAAGEPIHIPGGMGEDVITFGGATSTYPVATQSGDTIKIDTRAGGDLDKLDDVIDKDKHAQDLNDRDGE
jgi:hypothetical protein|tara:strand:+ start:128 stop:787 length:660 start_codon:yes stop_codon:yes gene_type:complete